MSTKRSRGRLELLQGTLDLLILRTLRWGPAHGHAIAKAIERGSDDVLLVEQGSLYPALHRLIIDGEGPQATGRRNQQMGPAGPSRRAHSSPRCSGVTP